MNFIIDGFNITPVVEKKQPKIDLKHLETFCRVAKLKSFSKAAEDLFLTQPTVSGHILSLEKSLSLKLFDRTNREVQLTQAGQILLKYASTIMSTQKELLNALSEYSQGIRGELSIGASTIPGEYLLPKLIGDFKKKRPNSLISLKIADTKEVVQYILKFNVEFGIIGAMLNHPSLQYEKFEGDEIIVISPPHYPFQIQKKRPTLKDLLKEPWIIREEGSGTQMTVEKALKRIGMSLKQFNVVMEMGSTLSVKEGVKARLGLAFISKRAVQEELEGNLLSQIEINGIEPISRQIYIVSHRGRTISPLGKEFLQFLRGQKN